MRNLNPAVSGSVTPSFGARVPTAGELRHDAVFVNADLANKKVFELFERDPELLNIPVVDDGEVVGLINRDHFMRSMARRFHWEIYADKKCSKMMSAVPLAVEADTPVSELADLLLAQRNSHHLSNGFVIKRGKALVGTGLTSDVLAALLFYQRLLGEELARANERLVELTVTDTLTGLYNRRHFTEILPGELHRAHRDGRLPALMMLDLDYFKRLNDHLGHQAGDRALVAVAKALKDTLRRSSDHCFRLGGEEFAVLVVGRDQGSIMDLAETLRGNIENLRLENPGHPLGIVTVSGGIAISRSADDTPDSLYEQADGALYAAKDAGRNRLVLA